MRYALSSIILIALVSASSFSQAQSPGQGVIFAWNGTLYFQAIPEGPVNPVGSAFEGFANALNGADVYSLAAAPLPEAPSEGYGFHHGVWSPDRDQLVYLEVRPPEFRLRLYQLGGTNQILLESQSNPQHGYLDPIAWTNEGDILLLSRVLLNHLPRIQVWRFNLSTQALTYELAIPTERLNGRTALLPDGQSVFLGYHLPQAIGYLLEVATLQVSTFPTQLQQGTLPAIKGFEYYPLRVFGGIENSQLSVLQNSALPAEALPRPAPFLHWPLADSERSITCYADSVWTSSNFPVTCPGLSAQRVYPGHQGTDVGGKPEGLPIGTPVYPSALGTVVATYGECQDGDPSCNNAYGNTVTLEHILIQDGTTQLWYTGYGHLQSILVEENTYLSDLTLPLGLSGATGVGGPHLHFEVRTTDNWADPWDNRTGPSLWLGSNIRPLALVGQPTDQDELPSQVLAICTTPAGNNIRNGPGTLYDSLAKTAEGSTYDVLEIAFVAEGEALGDWYRVRYPDGEGWLWSGLMTCP